MSSIQIPLLKPDSQYTLVEVYPDELPQEATEIMDPLVAEYAPLMMWKTVALEYYRQGMHDQFLEVLTSVVEEIETPEVKQIYKDKGSYRDIVEIYGILAANSIFTQGDEGLALSSTIKNITTWLNHADTINKANEYPALVSGFFQILRGQLDSADVYFKRIKQRKYLYGASVGLAVTAYLRKNYNAAYDQFNKALTLSSSVGPAVRIAAAACCFHVSKIEKARDLTEKALQMDPTNLDGLVLLSLLDLYAAQKNPQAARDLRKSAHDYCMLVEKLGSKGARGGMVGSACAMAMNHLANQAFYSWLDLDHNARSPSSESADQRMVILSAQASLRVTEGMVAAGDLVRIDKDYTSLVTDVIVSNEQCCLILTDPIPANSFGRRQVELKEVNRIKDLTSRAFKGTSNKDIKGESLFMLGRLSHMLGDLPSAYRYYEDALQLAPNNYLVQFAVAKRLLAQTEFAQALELFEKVRSSCPDDKDTNAYIALIKAIHKQEIVPFDKLKECASGFPFEADLWLLQGQLRLRTQSEFGTALRCYESALAVVEKQRRPVNPLLLSNIAVLQVSLGQPIEAAASARRGLSDLEAELQVSIDSGTAHPFSSDNADHRNPMFYQHDNDVFCAWSQVSGTVDAISLENYLSSLPGTSRHVSAGDQRKCGFSYFKGGLTGFLAAGDQLIISRTVLVTVQEVFSTPDGVYFIGKGMQKIRPPLDSDEDFISPAQFLGLSVQKKIPGLNFNEKTITLCYDYALILEECGQTNAAIEIYEELIKIYPNYTECYIRLSKSCVSMGRAKNGLVWLQRALAISPKDTDVHTALADLHVSQGDSARVMKILMDLCTAKDARAHISVANIKRGEMTAMNIEQPLKESYKFYHHVLGSDKRSSHAANGLGIVLAEKHKLEAARDTFTRVRESNAAGSDIANSACVNLAIVNLAQKKYVDTIQLLHTCMRGLAASSRPSESSTMCGQMEIGNLLAMTFVATEYFRDAIRMLSKVIFLNPTVLHLWYNIAYVREEFAVNSLRKVPKSSGVMDAIADLDCARSIFRQINGLLTSYNGARQVSANNTISSSAPSGGAFLRGLSIAPDTLRNVAPNMISFDKKLSVQHELYCEGSMKKADNLLQRQLLQEENENSRRNQLTELHQQRVQALESQREQEEKEKEARRLELQEKALQKVTDFERLKSTWASMPTASEKKRSSGKKKSKIEPGFENDVEYSDGDENVEAGAGPLDNLVDSDDNPSVSEEDVDFGSDASSVQSDQIESNDNVDKEKESKKKKDKKHKKDKKGKKDNKEKKKEKRDRKRAREEEGSDRNIEASGSRLKKRLVMSDDEDEDLFKSTAEQGSVRVGGDDLYDSDDVREAAGPALQPMEDEADLPRVNRAARVIGGDDEDEEWNE